MIKRKIKSKKLTLIVVAEILIILGILSLYRPAVPESAQIPIDKNLQQRQGLNQCGPYSVMAVINALKQESMSPDLIDSSMKWRLQNRMTLPIGLTGFLKENNIKTKHKLLLFQSDSKRLDYLRWKLSKGRPLILLNQTPQGIQHYYTLLGYGGGDFYIYDSLLELVDNSVSRVTVDKNGDLPGNRTLTSMELLEEWGGGGKYFFGWFLIESWLGG